MIHTANLRDATYITANLRRQDRAETLAQLDVNMVQLGAMLCHQPYAYIAYSDRPVMVFGASPMSRTTVSAWAIGTDRTRRVIPEVTRFINGPLAKQLVDDGYRWAEARSMEGHDAAHRWLRDMGAERVLDLPDFGAGGEKFHLFRRALIPYAACKAA